MAKKKVENKPSTKKDSCGLLYVTVLERNKYSMKVGYMTLAKYYYLLNRVICKRKISMIN